MPRTAALDRRVLSGRPLSRGRSRRDRGKLDSFVQQSKPSSPAGGTGLSGWSSRAIHRAEISHDAGFVDFLQLDGASARNKHFGRKRSAPAALYFDYGQNDGLGSDIFLPSMAGYRWRYSGCPPRGRALPTVSFEIRRLVTAYTFGRYPQLSRSGIGHTWLWDGRVRRRATITTGWVDLCVDKRTGSNVADIATPATRSFTRRLQPQPRRRDRRRGSTGALFGGSRPRRVPRPCSSSHTTLTHSLFMFDPL
jgi:hypothetical protein